MSKTQFVENSFLTPTYCNTIYGNGPSGGHRHTGTDSDGFCDKINLTNGVEVKGILPSMLLGAHVHDSTSVRSEGHELIAPYMQPWGDWVTCTPSQTLPTNGIRVTMAYNGAAQTNFTLTSGGFAYFSGIGHTGHLRAHLNVTMSSPGNYVATHIYLYFVGTWKAYAPKIAVSEQWRGTADTGVTWDGLIDNALVCSAAGGGVGPTYADGFVYARHNDPSGAEFGDDISYFVNFDMTYEIA
jgi:hypothetical protein